MAEQKPRTPVVGVISVRSPLDKDDALLRDRTPPLVPLPSTEPQDPNFLPGHPEATSVEAFCQETERKLYEVLEVLHFEDPADPRAALITKRMREHMLEFVLADSQADPHDAGGRAPPLQNAALIRTVSKSFARLVGDILARARHLPLPRPRARTRTFNLGHHAVSNPAKRDRLDFRMALVRRQPCPCRRSC